MRISTRGHYGLRFALDLAADTGGGFVPITGIAKRQNVSEKYLWQVVAPLRARGIVQVARGITGGYKLARPASAITVRELIEALEGRISFTEQGGADASSRDPSRRVARELWASLARGLATAAEKITLQDLVNRRKLLEATPVDYSI
jgi:Rrf2 family protein